MIRQPVAFAAAILFAGCGSQTPPEQPATAVFVNGAVFTADANGTIAEAAAIRDGTIVGAGTHAAMMALTGPDTQVIDMDGGMLLPGFTDAHVHLVDGGDTLTSLSVHEAETVDEVLDAVRAYAAEHPELDTIIGSGWALPLFEGGNPHKSMLDSAEQKRPVVLYAADGHNAWVNSAALEAAGVDASTPDPINGKIERDPATGEPSGALRESATQLVDALVPPMTAESALSDLLAAMQFQNRMGYTASIDASVPPGPMAEAFISAVKSGEATLRVELSLLPTSDFTDKAFSAGKIEERIAGLEARRASIEAADPALLTAGMVKIFLDGVLENQTGALLEPYHGASAEAGYAGVLNMAPDLLEAYAVALDGAGFDMHMHAIGDRAVREGLDAIEAAVKANPPRDRHHHIAHIELIDPADIPRFAETGATANMQALWAYGDSYITDLTEPFLGEERSQWLYPFASLRDAGARLASGSDWPVSTSDPFDAIEVAAARVSPDGDTPVWRPEQRIAVADMLKALTIEGAVLMGQDEMRGSIEPGKRADLVLIDANPLAVDVSAISDIDVVMTLLGGEAVYRRNSGAP